MSFAVAAEAYDRFMGRYSARLAPQLADLAGVAAGQRLLDVGCGPGALTTELVRRAGADSVSAVDPSDSFVAAVRERVPDVEVHQAPAESLPFSSDSFDASLAQLVVHFMSDPVSGLREMGRVTKADGVVAACVWDHANGPLSVFWAAAREADSGAEDESRLPGVREGHLGELFRASGLGDVAETTLSVELEHPTFEEWWDPFTLGVGLAGDFVARLDAQRRDELRDRCRARLPEPPFRVAARAWAARGLAP